MRNLTITQVQVDEIWAFSGAKQKNVPADADLTLGLGDCYTYTSIDPVTKLMPCWTLGYRSKESADHFIGDLASRLACRAQLTTDGVPGHPAAVAKHFGATVDYDVLNLCPPGRHQRIKAPVQPQRSDWQHRCCGPGRSVHEAGWPQPRTSSAPT